MTTVSMGPTGGSSLGDGSDERSAGGWLIAGGSFCAILSLLLFISPAVGSVSVTALIGVGLLLGGIAMLVVSIMARTWGGAILGSILAIAGFLLWTDLLQGTATLTALLIIWLVVDGIVGGIVHLVQRAPGWGVGLFTSVLSLILGLLLWADFPSSAEWVLGVYAGIVLLLRGLSLIAAGLLLRQLA